MNITEEQKRLFFTQYWGQSVVRFRNWDTWDTQLPSKEVNRHQITKFMLSDGNYLQLRPLSDITKEEAQEVIHIHRSKFASKPKYVYKVKYIIPTDKGVCIDFKEPYSELLSSLVLLPDSVGSKIVPSHNPFEILDYLRSKSFALDYSGITVDRMVTEGIVVLKPRD